MKTKQKKNNHQKKLKKFQKKSTKQKKIPKKNNKKTKNTKKPKKKKKLKAGEETRTRSNRTVDATNSTELDRLQMLVVVP